MNTAKANRIQYRRINRELLRIPIAERLQIEKDAFAGALKRIEDPYPRKLVENLSRWLGNFGVVQAAELVAKLGIALAQEPLAEVQDLRPTTGSRSPTDDA